MHSILKKFFLIRTQDRNFLKHHHKNTLNNEKDIYMFKFSKKAKSILYLNFLNCFGCMPICSKTHKRFKKIESEGEERLKKYINARYIIGILQSHHNALKNQIVIDHNGK